MDSRRFDGLARAIGERGKARTGDQEQAAAVKRLVAPAGTRRQVLGGLMATVLLSQLPNSADAGCRSKEGKEKRQCRRRQRKKNAPGGILDCPDLKSCYYVPGAPDAWPITLGPLPGGTTGQCWSWEHFSCYPCQNTREYYNGLCRTTYASKCGNGMCVAGT